MDDCIFFFPVSRYGGNWRGVPMEEQGGDGSAGSHWDARVMHTEAGGGGGGVFFFPFGVERGRR